MACPTCRVPHHEDDICFLLDQKLFSPLVIESIPKINIFPIIFTYQFICEWIVVHNTFHICNILHGCLFQSFMHHGFLLRSPSSTLRTLCFFSHHVWNWGSLSWFRNEHKGIIPYLNILMIKLLEGAIEEPP